jgi:hypothetical protein
MLAFFKSQKGRSGMEMPQIVAYGRILYQSHANRPPTGPASKCERAPAQREEI